MQSSSSWLAPARNLLVALLYAVAVIWSSVSPSGWTVVVVALPLAAMLFSYAVACWRKSELGLFKRLKGVACLLAFVGVLIGLEPFLMENFKWVYLLQHAGIHLALGWCFANSLKAGAVPLCTQFARIVHPDEVMSDGVLRYTRQVTLAWACFFAFIGIGSLIVFCFCSLAVWTVFSTFVTMALTAAMFAVEAVIRRRVLPASYRSNLISTWHAVERHFRQGQTS